jgi:hypothetical protein
MMPSSLDLPLLNRGFFPKKLMPQQLTVRIDITLQKARISLKMAAAGTSVSTS